MTIEPFVVIKGRVIIGNDVTIRSGAVIGCKGSLFQRIHRVKMSLWRILPGSSSKTMWKFLNR
ncbi:MAG: hypothetical protein ACLUIW_00615 [Dysosmobacter welbionis]